MYALYESNFTVFKLKNVLLVFITLITRAVSYEKNFVDIGDTNRVPTNHAG